MENNETKSKKNIIIVIAVVVVAAIILILFFVFGNKKVLECSIEQTTMGIKTTVTLNATFKGNEVQKIDGKAVYDLSTSSLYKNADEKTLDTAYEAMEKSLQSQKSMQNVKGSRNGKTVTFDYDMDLDFFGSDHTSTIEDAKEGLEKVGYTCK